jgi:PEP-CTERM motif
VPLFARSAFSVDFIYNLAQTRRPLGGCPLNFSIRSLVIALGFFILPAAAFGDVYDSANFSAGIFGGNANVSAPFTSILTQGETFTGSFVYDVNQIPPSGSGFDNVFFSGFPDIAAIPPATAFSLPLGSLNFNLGNAVTPMFGTQEAAIQYNNGNFSGFFYISDFTFTDGNPYELSIEGGILAIHLLDAFGNPEGSSLVNGFVDFGAGLTNVAPFTPVSATPEPSSILLFVTGLLGIVFVIRQRA